MSGYKIEHQCPQCGAPAILEETDRLFKCAYCRVQSYLLRKNYFRYILPSKAPAGKGLFYVPYWRFKGMLFSSAGNTIHHRFIDASHQALGSSSFPISVGLRSQTLKLKFVLPKTKGLFLRPTQPFEKAMQIFKDRFNTGLPRPIYHQAHIGETLSMIYSPFYMDKKIMDGILNRPIAHHVPKGFNIADLPSKHPNDHIRFIAAICPGCGWNLDGQRDSLVLTCSNCQSAWRPGTGELRRLKISHIATKSKTVIYLPFWRVKAGVTNLDLATYADLIRLANLPMVIRKSWETTEFHFWSLGFKVRHKDFLRLSRGMTLSQPRDNIIREMPSARLHPVTLPVTEAAESMKIILASFAKPAKKILSRLNNITIEPKNFLLVYIPFTEKHHDLVNAELNMSINKNVLSFAGNL